MDVQNSKVGLGISALVLASLTTLTLKHASAFEISIGTTTLLILSWSLATKIPFIGYKVFMQNVHAGQQPSPSTSFPVSHWSSPIKPHDEELNALLELAISHVLRNTAKVKETCKTEQKHLYAMQQAVKSLQLASLKQCDSSQCNHLIDERLNYLDYHADKMILLIDKFSGISIKLEAIVNHACTAPSDTQIELVKSAQIEVAHLNKLLNSHSIELAAFNKNYCYDPAARVLARSSTHLQIVQQTLKADSDTLFNIIKAATYIRADLAKPEFNPPSNGSN